MNKQQVQHALRQALDSVPQAIGINNHMGSLYTSLPDQMDWVMQVVAERQLYFIDSKTTGKSVVAAKTAKYRVKSRSRDVFLDNDKSYKALDRQFNQLIHIAKQHGHAIAIGHPYPETYRYLKKNLPRLTQHGIKVVPASALLDLPAAPAQLIAETAKQITSGPIHAKPVQPGHQVEHVHRAELPAKAVQVEEPQAEAVDHVVEPVPELIPWHPPYLPQLPGFDTPAALPVTEPEWRRFYPQLTEPPVVAAPTLLLPR